MRRLARELVFQLAFAYSFTSQKDDETLELFLQNSELDESDKIYIKNTYEGVMKNYEKCLEIVAQNITGYTLDRVYKSDLVSMIYATYEIRFNNVPEKLAINEAIDIAKKYGCEKSGSFVNGVLAKIVSK